MNLEGKTILITGGGSGIGLELARRLAVENKVVIGGRDEAKLDRARVETPALRTFRLDVTSEEEARRAVAWLSSELGGLDLLVNNAGLLRGYALSSPGCDTNAVEDVEVNLLGAVRMTRLALPLLDASEGAVLFVSSAVALAAVPGFAVYAATKAAVHSLARSLRAELKPTGIRVFEALLPVVDTGQVQELDVPKLSAAAVVDAIITGLQQDREEIRVGRVRQLAQLARLSPRLADRIVTRALTPLRNP
ncbi:MAG TPA: SDR family NAD(P)-dependent oxidoreductase [Gaiellaceae bacterium]|nr:SDR family NAD(P)-dependent oxidoreductase [Gaiellaceae bacterium]